MILLIPQFRLIHHLQVLHLNSIMILLILMKELEMKEGLNKFKFHYDSINSHEQTDAEIRL